MSRLSAMKERRLFFKWSAKRVMSEKGNLLRLIGASLIVLALVEAVKFTFETVCIFLDADMSTPLFAAELFLIFAVGAPLFIGLSRMAYLMSVGEETDISNVLWGFESGNLRSSYIVSLVWLSDFFFLFAFSFALGKGIAYAFEGIYSEFFSPLSLILTALVIPFFSGAFSRMLMLPTAFFESGSVSDALRNSRRTVGGQSREISAFNYSFLPMLMLSVLSLGILFFVYLLPLYMISSHICASYFTGRLTSEKI